LATGFAAALESCEHAVRLETLANQVAEEAPELPFISNVIAPAQPLGESRFQ